MTIEKLAEQIYNECLADGEPVTKEESLEMARMELGAKDVKHNVTSTKEVKKVRTVKISDEKIAIFEFLTNVLPKEYDIDILKDNKLIEIHLNGKNFKLDLIETRVKGNY